MKKVLVLGAQGNLGSQIILALDKSSYEVIAWDQDDLDLSDLKSIVDKVSKLKVDIIINTSAYNSVDLCEESEKEFILAKKINGQALRYLSQAALENDSILIHYSTDYVFGGDLIQSDIHLSEGFLRLQEQGGFTEDSSPYPINNYGYSKRLGEIEIQRLAKKGLKYYIIRTSKLFGPPGTFAKAKESFFDLMLRLAQDREEVQVVNEELSCFTYTPDLAQESIRLLESQQDFGIYHIVNSGPAIWYDAARELFRLKEVNTRIKPVSAEMFPRPAKRPKYSVLANTKLPDLRPWNEALAQYLKEYN